MKYLALCIFDVKILAHTMQMRRAVNPRSKQAMDRMRRVAKPGSKQVMHKMRCVVNPCSKQAMDLAQITLF